VSRETRRLLAAAALSLLALWVLARIRFPDRPTTSNPVPPLLQVAGTATFTDLASTIQQARQRLGNMLLVQQQEVALRLSSSTALRLRPAGAGFPPPDGTVVLAADPASGATIVRVAESRAPATPVPWVPPARIDEPRYLLVTTVTDTTVSLRPVLIDSLAETPGPAWSGPLWSLPASAAIPAGSFLFTEQGELAGAVVQRRNDVVMVPALTLLADAARLAAHPLAGGGHVGVEVQSLTPALAAATGSTTGVAVSWVAVGSPAAAEIALGDVIDTIDGQPLVSVEQWDVAVARLAPGGTLTLGVRHDGTRRTVTATAVAAEAPAPPAAAAASLGLTMQRLPGIGTRIIRIAPGSAGARAGLQIGDVITLAADALAPTPAVIRARAADTASPGPLLLGVTRGDSHRLITLDR
jgi:hypothetical protein